jgi:hypothetical protein
VVDVVNLMLDAAQHPQFNSLTLRYHKVAHVPCATSEKAGMHTC